MHANIHKIKRNIRSNRQAYTLNYTGKHAYKAMNMVMPFLVRKRPEAEAVNLFWLEGQMDMRTGRKFMPQEIWEIREWWYKKLRRMK